MPKVAVDRLQPGVFITLGDIGWLHHPFLLNAFILNSDKQVQALRAMGLMEIDWDPERSTAKPLPDTPTSSTEEDFGSAALAGMLDEKKLRIERVRQLRESFARREREYEKEVSVAAELLKSLASRPNEAHAQAKALVGRVVDNLLSAENEVIQLVAGKGKESGTASHSLNVMMLSLLLGKLLKLPEEDMKHLGLGALLHDAGKAEVPLRILRANPRPPPEEEFYRAHVGYGIKVVAGMRELPVPVKNVIACHHERWDGNGFPNRLVAEKIPRLARIVAIANRYDNLCNAFDLKQAKTPAEAIAHLFKNEVVHFQNELLQLFVKTLGIYPPGCFVRLSNDGIGLVLETNTADILHPKLMLYDRDIPRAEALLIDLRDTDLKVAGAISPASLPVEVVEYLAPRGRLDYVVEGARSS